MKSVKKKSTIILFLLLLSIFGYSQFQSASQISVSISENAIINENDSEYEIELEFTNPSLLTLPAGKSEFFVFYDNEIVGKGDLESFTLYPISSILVKGTFTTDTNSDESKSVKISGIIKYDLLVTTIEIPFDYYPTKEQTRKFIQ
ncbi:MAG: hypothetical protein HOF28_02490 [Nitrosopumilus sp.]|jgi:hypothetical protein|nr:hypothetical protein [Nitrosopumilus sp.]